MQKIALAGENYQKFMTLCNAGKLDVFATDDKNIAEHSGRQAVDGACKRIWYSEKKVANLIDLISRTPYQLLSAPNVEKAYRPSSVEDNFRFVLMSCGGS